MQIRRPITNATQVVPEILSGSLAPIVRYILVSNSDIRAAAVCPENIKTSRNVTREVTLALLQQASVDILTHDS